MRIRILLTLALFLLVACQWNGAGKLSLASNAEANTRNADALPHASPVPSKTTTAAATFTDADFTRHVARLKAEIKKKLTSSDRRAPAAEFSFVIQPPFVVIGDESKPTVQERAEGTVKWAVDRLKQDFFSSDPQEILDIFLFKDAAS